MTHLNYTQRVAGKLDPHLRLLLQNPSWVRNSRSQRKVRVIVEYAERLNPHHLCHLIKCVGSKHATNHRKLDLIQSVSLTMPLDKIHSLCQNPSVHYIHMDRKKSLRLNWATPTIGAAAAHRKGITGKGVTIAILDTGVYPHRDLTVPVNRLIAFKDLVHGRAKPYDDNGHGTHCAGCAAGNGSSSGGVYTGAAAEAKLVGVKVMNRQGEGFDSTIIRGIQWCIQNQRKYGIRIISLSVGGKADKIWQKDPLCKAVNEAWRKGILVVAAAGNSGPAGATIDSPGISPVILTVGASNDRKTTKLSDDSVAQFSSRGPAIGGVSKPDLLAPGTNVVSLRVPGSYLDKERVNDRVGRSYFSLSGTSTATPLTAGAAALWLQKHPRLSPDQLKANLKRSAYRLQNNPFVQGSGILNVRPVISR